MTKWSKVWKPQSITIEAHYTWVLKPHKTSEKNHILFRTIWCIFHLLSLPTWKIWNKNYKYSHFKKSQLFSDIIMFYFLSLPNPTSSHQLQIMAATNMECNNNIGKQIRWKNVRICVFWQLSNIQFIETDLHF